MATRGQIDAPQFKGLAHAVLKYHGNIGEIRSAGALPDEAQRLVDTAVVRVGLERLSFVGDLISEGLVFPISNFLGVMEVYWEKEGKIGHAERVMLPTARGERQMPARVGARIPNYLTIDDFSFNVRVLLASERSGAPLDVSMVEQATRRVNEAIEDAGINGAGISVAGHDAPGLLNAPNVNTYQYVGGEAWDVVGHTGEEILSDVLAMIDVLQGDGYYGPYNLYLPTLYGSKLNQDFKSATSGTIRERLEAIEAGGRTIRIRVADRLPANRVALVQMTSNVVDVIVGQQPIPISWEEGPGWDKHFVVLANVVPRIRDDADGKSGIVLGNTT